MKALHLPHGYWPAVGGAEVHVQETSAALVARGVDVDVVVADLASPEGLYRFDVGPTDRPPTEIVRGVRVERVPLGWPRRAGAALYRHDPYMIGGVADRIRSRDVRRLRRAMSAALDRSPDVVLTMPHLFVNVRIAFDLHRSRGFPLVWMPLLHEADPNWPIDAMRAAVPQADAIVTLTEHAANRLVSAYGADPDQVHVVSPGVSRVAAPIPPVPGVPTVLSIGRLTHGKGVGLLIEAMQHVWRREPEVDLILLGATAPDTPQLEEALNELTEDERRHTTVLPDATRGAKATALERATVLVSTSKIESFGLVILEAWASGTPVVGIDTPVNREVISEGNDGLLVPPSAPEDLATALLGLVHDPIAAGRMGAAGRRRTNDHFSWEQSAERLETVYRSVIG